MKMQLAMISAKTSVLHDGLKQRTDVYSYIYI